MPYVRYVTTDRRSPRVAGRPCYRTNGVSRDDASKEVTMPTGATVPCPGAGSSFHPKTSCNRVELQMAPTIGRAMHEAPPTFLQSESGEGLRPEKNNCCTCSPRQAGTTTMAAPAEEHRSCSIGCLPPKPVSLLPLRLRGNTPAPHQGVADR
jgi:hypothetical protein